MPETPPVEKTLVEKPHYLVLNKTIVNMRNVDIIRKSNHGTRCFVIVMKNGYEDQSTAKYDFESDFEQDWRIISNTLLSMNSN